MELNTQNPMRRFLLFLFLLPGIAVARADKKSEIQRGTQTRSGLVFIRRGGRALHLNLIRPAILPAKPLPIVLWVHGGLWRSGNADKMPPLLYELARRGFASASVEFRGSNEAVFPAQLDDLRAATRFLRQNARAHSLDGDKIGVAGISTGAQLASLLALGGGTRCAVDICGPSDLTTLAQGSRLDWNASEGPLFAFLGGAASDKLGLARTASPIFHVSKGAPPFLILHGDGDSLVSIAQSEALFQKLKASGSRVSYRVYQGEEHGLRGAREQTEDEIVAFLGKWLR